MRATLTKTTITGATIAAVVVVLATGVGFAGASAARAEAIDTGKAHRATFNAARGEARSYTNTTAGSAAVTAVRPCQRRSLRTATCRVVYRWTIDDQHAGCNVHETFTVTQQRSGRLRVRGTRALWRAERCDGGQAVLRENETGEGI
jgi:hypothetical protein